MVSFRRFHSHLKLLSNNDLKGTRTETGFKRAFATLFGQDLETFTGTMFLNMDQLEKQLDNEEFQEIGSMAAFKVLETQFQMFIKSRIYLDDEYVIMTRNYFLQYTQLEIPEFRKTLIQHMESVKKSIDERAQHKREYDSRVNDRQMQIIKEKVDTSKALDASLVDTESNGTESKEQPMAEVQTTAEINVYATGQQHTEQPEFNNEGEENETLKKHYKELYDSIKTTRAKTIEHTTSLIALNADFKAQLQEKGYAIAALKNKLRKITGNSVNTKFAKSLILGKPVLQPHRNQSVVRQPTAFKSERPRISKPQFASQVDVNNDLSKPVTTHYLPKERESAVVKPHHVIASSESRNSSKNMPRFSSNDMVHNHYLEEAKKKTQEIGRWIPTRKIFTSSTTKVDSDPTNGSNEDITNQYECEQTLNVSAAMTSDHKSSELGIHDYNNEPSSSKLVSKVVPLADKTATSRQDSYKDGDRDASLQLKSDSLPHAHAQTTKIYYKNQDSRIKKAQELKDKDFCKL
ncbi:hypothetical protein Tco_1106543 [Tanacetum coccineum]